MEAVTSVCKPLEAYDMRMIPTGKVGSGRETKVLQLMLKK